MDERKKQLEAPGWVATSVQELLDLTPADMAFIELKLRLSRELRSRRTAVKLTQTELAALIKSSQSRVAKMEGGDPTVSVDLLLRSLFQLGATAEDIAHAITT